jgi:hypothetical protein
MTGTNCDLFTHKSCRSYLNHLVCVQEFGVHIVILLLILLINFVVD